MVNIIIKGKFVVEGLNGFNNVKLPLKYLEIKVFPIQPYQIEAFSSYEEKEDSD